MEEIKRQAIIRFANGSELSCDPKVILSYYHAGGRCNGKTLTMAELCRDLITKANPDIRRVPDIKNVIFNPPATIVMWADGTKTVVKAVNEDYDPEKGLAMAIAKKALGNKGNYFNDIKKWADKYDVKSDYPKVNPVNKLSDGLKKCADSTDKLARDLEKTVIKVLRKNNADAHGELSAILKNTHATKKDLTEAIERACYLLRRTIYAI